MKRERPARREDAFIVPGKLALPYKYFAGRIGSRFLVALRDRKRILGIRSSDGGRVLVPPRAVDEERITEACGEWVELPGTGTVTGFTVVRYSEPYQPYPPPYILALIKLDGADTALTHIVRGIAPEAMRIGLRVRAEFAEEPTSTIMDIACFRPLEGVEEAPTPSAAGKPLAGDRKRGYSYDELQIGMTASFTKTISETDVYLFAGISGDFNPLHLDEEYARESPFGTRIAHGALPQCLIAPVLGMKLPGLGTIALEIVTRFKAPTRFGDTITARATVAEKRDDRRWVRLDCEWTNQHGETVATGHAWVIPPA
jgi:acyl dehydratase/uncharacterized OB-fold protein